MKKEELKKAKTKEEKVKVEKSMKTKDESVSKSKQHKIAEKNIKKVKDEASEFKKFISRGNVVDMAVGVIIGGAFGKIVTSLVNDIITPLIGIIIGGLDFSNLNLQIGNAKVAYGSFIQAIIDFLIIAICIFTVVRLFERLKHKEKEEDKKEESSKKSDEVALLEEIRDLLKDKQPKRTSKNQKNSK